MDKDTLRILLLESVYDFADGSLTKNVSVNLILAEYSNIPEKDIHNEILYWKNKGYLEGTVVSLHYDKYIPEIRLNVHSIDLVEKYKKEKKIKIKDIILEKIYNEYLKNNEEIDTNVIAKYLNIDEETRYKSVIFLKNEHLIKWISEIGGIVEITNEGIKKIENDLVGGNMNKNQLGNDIFIVHGRNDGLKETCARFIEKLKLKAIILHEQPNKGRTIIEKFEDYSNVGFAIVLMTADDVGNEKDNSSNLNPRARQNVIFELGYFIGKIGRETVCALYEEGVEIPSDYQGVTFIKIDNNNNWKLEVAKEIKSSGIDVDLNDAI